MARRAHTVDTVTLLRGWEGWPAGSVGRKGKIKIAVDDPLHLLPMPVAGVRDQHLGDLREAGSVKHALGGVGHRLQIPEVRATVITSAAITI